MKKQMGGIKLITLIGVIIALIIIAFAYIFIMKGQNSKNQETGKNTETNVSKVDNPTEEVPVSDVSNGPQDDNQPNIVQVFDPKNLIKTDFTLSFLKQENNNKNMIYSPLSIKYALKMLQEGASGETLNQIKSVIGNLEVPKYPLIEGNLSLANSIFIRDTYYDYVKQNFINTLQNKYDAEVIKDTFENANNANQWIENKTLGIIKKMIDDETVRNPNMKMLLINALAMDMKWKEKFDTSETSGETFYLDNGSEIQATAMRRETESDDAKFYVQDGITALTMDLECDSNDSEFEFMAIMPSGNLKEFVNKLSIEEINNIDKNLKSASETNAGINITIPKFSFEYDLNLKEDLQNLGIKDAFDEDLADFSNMAQTELYVGKALHKAKIDFTEQGVKAAAVTVFAMFAKSVLMHNPEIPIEINLNKPFVFLIRDKKTKEIWFTGTMYEPNLWENDKELYE